MSDTPQAGHNGDTKAQLQSFVDRLYERETEKQAVAQDVRDIKTEIKEAGMSPAAVAAIVKEKMRDAEKAAKAADLAEIIDQYKAALGLLDGTPLGEAAVNKFKAA